MNWYSSLKNQKSIKAINILLIVKSLNKQNIPLVAGSFFGLTAVLMDAFGAHYLSTIFDSSQMNIYQTATTYQMFHALILCCIGFYLLHNESKYLKYSSYFFIVGMILFSFSLYLYLITNIMLIAIFTPIGGSFLILGWIILLVYGITYKKN